MFETKAWMGEWDVDNKASDIKSPGESRKSSKDEGFNDDVYVMTIIFSPDSYTEEAAMEMAEEWFGERNPSVELTKESRKSLEDEGFEVNE